MPASVIDPELRARLNLAKLRALVRAHTGSDEAQERSMGSLPAVLSGIDGFVLAADGAGIGAALAWARRQHLTGVLHVFADAAPAEGAPDSAAVGVLARRARYFRDAPVVLAVSDGAGGAATVAVAEPLPHRPLAEPRGDALVAIEPLRAAGADIVIEHGVVMAEIAGLEVGRVVADAEGNGVHLEVGVGRHDREAAQIMEAVLSPGAVTSSVLDVVRSHRRAGHPPHLLTRLARQRWLRARIMADPALVGAAALEPIEPPLPRANLVDPVPALAAGRTAAGRPIVVACAVGVDLEAVPTAADARDRFDPEAELVYAAPARDQYPVVRDLADRLLRPARLVTVDGEWVD